MPPIDKLPDLDKKINDNWSFNVGLRSCRNISGYNNIAKFGTRLWVFSVLKLIMGISNYPIKNSMLAILQVSNEFVRTRKTANVMKQVTILKVSYLKFDPPLFYRNYHVEWLRHFHPDRTSSC